MPTGTAVASAPDFRSCSFSRSPQWRNVRLSSSRFTSLRRRRASPLRGSGISDQSRKLFSETSYRLYLHNSVLGQSECWPVVLNRVCLQAPVTTARRASIKGGSPEGVCRRMSAPLWASRLHYQRWKGHRWRAANPWDRRPSGDRRWRRRGWPARWQLLP